MQDPNWSSPGLHATGWTFAALVFWTFCFAMSRYSLRIERQLETSHR
jgi:general L-amino acid transport system permease protein